MSESDEARLILPDKTMKPPWVQRWERARAAGDHRPFPEQIAALDALGRQDPEHYRIYRPPSQPVSDREFWVQPDEYLEGESAGLPAIVE